MSLWNWLCLYLIPQCLSLPKPLHAAMCSLTVSPSLPLDRLCALGSRDALGSSADGLHTRGTLQSGMEVLVFCARQCSVRLPREALCGTTGWLRGAS